MAQLLLTVVRFEFSQKDIILLSRAPIITYKGGKPTSVENRNLIYSSIPAGTIQFAILIQRQDWEPPQIKDLKLVYQNTIHFWLTILCLSRLAYPTNTLKRLG